MVVLDQIPYGPDKIPHLKNFSVSFSGKPGMDLSGFHQPVQVRALDESDAWSQVVRHYRLDWGKVECHRLTPMVIRID